MKIDLIGTREMLRMHGIVKPYDATKRPMLDGSPDLVRDRLLALVEQILIKKPADRTVGVHDPLTAVGLSSIDMVNLMLAVEAEFDITIPAADITPQNFRSIATIEALIAKIAR